MWYLQCSYLNNRRKERENKNKNKNEKIGNEFLHLSKSNNSKTAVR